MEIIKGLSFYMEYIGEVITGFVMGSKKSKKVRKQPKILIGIVCVILTLITVKSAFNRILSPLNNEFIAEELGLEVVEITILPGDTSWNIQQELAPHHDTRLLLHHSSFLNDSSSLGYIKPGEVKLFYKESH